MKWTRNFRVNSTQNWLQFNRSITSYKVSHNANVYRLLTLLTDDKRDINRGRSALVSQINNVLCFFRTLDSIAKLRLLISYCYSLYWFVIWDITNVHVEQVCSAWRAVCVAFGAFRSILTMCWCSDLWQIAFVWWDTEAHADLYSELLTKWQWSC